MIISISYLNNDYRFINYPSPDFPLNLYLCIFSVFIIPISSILYIYLKSEVHVIRNCQNIARPIDLKDLKFLSLFITDPDSIVQTFGYKEQILLSSMKSMLVAHIIGWTLSGSVVVLGSFAAIATKSFDIAIFLGILGIFNTVAMIPNVMRFIEKTVKKIEERRE